MNRVAALNEAARLTSGDRDQEYGHPYDNLSKCARLWTAYLQSRFEGSAIDPAQFVLTAEDAAHMAVLQKMSRIFNGKVKADTYVDEACYAAIAGECAEIEKQKGMIEQKDEEVKITIDDLKKGGYVEGPPGVWGRADRPSMKIGIGTSL